MAAAGQTTVYIADDVKADYPALIGYFPAEWTHEPAKPASWPADYQQLCQGKIASDYAKNSYEAANIIIESRDGGGDGAIRSFIYINILAEDEDPLGKLFYIDLICRGQELAHTLRDKVYGEKAIPLIQKLQQVCMKSAGDFNGIRLSALDHVQMFYDKKLGFKSRTHWRDGRRLNRMTSNHQENGVPMLWVVPLIENNAAVYGLPGGLGPAAAAAVVPAPAVNGPAYGLPGGEEGEAAAAVAEAEEEDRSQNDWQHELGAEIEQQKAQTRANTQAAARAENRTNIPNFNPHPTPGTHKRKQGGGKTRKWSNIAPKRGKQRTRMLKRCGRKCFLATRKRFPVCAKGTCKVNKKGLRAAYMRARSTGTRSNKLKRKMSPIAKRAKKRLRNFKN